MATKGFWRRQWHPTPVLLPGKSHGRRSLVGCSPRGRKETDTTERLHFHFSLSCIGEGNGNPLQYSCLENPRDRSVVGCRLWGLTESDTTEVTAAAAAQRGSVSFRGDLGSGLCFCGHGAGLHTCEVHKGREENWVVLPGV